ncbi:MAG TPA: hypothetical protein VM573_06885 [Actinomycetota bacterium]|nr:hypothetical protein [Actinomycetota bacterium]
MNPIEKARSRAVEIGVYLPLGAYAKAREGLADLDRTAVMRLFGDLIERGQERLAPVERRLRRRGEEAGRATKKAAARGRAATSSRAPKVAATVLRPSQLPIDGYDDRTVDEILPELAGLTQSDLAKVYAYEKANAKRSTVLDAIDGKMSPLPIADYDALTADEINKRLASLDESDLKKLRSYEEDTRGRVTVLEKIDSLLA